MKRFISCALALLFVSGCFAQTAQTVETTQAVETVDTQHSATEKSEWLQSFSAVHIEAPIEVTFVRIPDNEAPKIVYDTKGSYTTKFRFEVKNRVLRINERADSRRPGQTKVTIYYNVLDALSITYANATFREPITAKLFDLSIGAHASLTATLDVKDLNMELTSRGSAKVEGTVRYLTLYVSNGTVDGLGLETMAARVNVTSGGSVTLDVTERMEATTSTSGTINYKTEPPIVRGGMRFMGGSIEQAQ